MDKTVHKEIKKLFIDLYIEKNSFDNAFNVLHEKIISLDDKMAVGNKFYKLIDAIKKKLSGTIFVPEFQLLEYLQSLN